MALSQAKFCELVAEHGPALYKLAFRLVGDRYDAEDVVQEAFRSAWKSRHNYQPGRGDRAWLATILRRRVADSYRKRTLRLVLTGDNPIDVAAGSANPHAEEFTDEVQRCLDQLPPELRETLLLVVVGELTHQEAADVLEIPVGTVLSRVSRARNRMREYLVPQLAKSTEEGA